MKKNIKALFNILSKTWYGFALVSFLRYLYTRDPLHRKLKIKNYGSIRFATKEVSGGGNILMVGKKTLLYKVFLRVRGYNNRIIIGENCRFGKGCKLYLFGNNTELIIGDGCTFSHDDNLMVEEDGAKIEIGKDCMFAYRIDVRTSDVHPIYDKKTGNRINKSRNVYIGNHVWVTVNCIIQKGVRIGDGAIVASNSIVTKDIPSNSVAAGMPAKVVKDNIRWDRKLMK